MEGIALRSGIGVWLSLFGIGGRFCGFLHLHLDAQPIETVSGFAVHTYIHISVHTCRHIRNFRNNMILTIAVLSLLYFDFLGAYDVDQIEGFVCSVV